EELLFLPPIERGRDWVTERHLRTIATEPDWQKQRRMWRALRQEKPLASSVIPLAVPRTI
ncbi:MAG: hypothetical protein ACUVQK_15650, partial [Thermogutta sp.]